MKPILHDKVLTIPNLLSLLRLCLIPVFVWLYLGRDDPLGTVIVLIISGLTDTLDGWIARRFDMVSELGKTLDPVADKLTQLLMLLCLLFRFPAMRWLFAVLFCKEIFVGTTSLIASNKAGTVLAVVWQGKMTTTLLYSTMILHLLWTDIPTSLSNALIVICICSVLLSGVLYGVRNLHMIKKELAIDG